jgi:hypothetical protein
MCSLFFGVNIFIEICYSENYCRSDRYCHLVKHTRSVGVQPLYY